MNSKTITLAQVALTAVLVGLMDAQPSRFEGDWQGALKIQAFELRVVFHLQMIKEGSWKATMDSPDQGAAGIGVDSVLVANENVRLVVGVAHAEYEAKLELGDSVMTGAWKQGGMALPLSVKKTTAPVTVRRPQEPQPPYPYFEEEVTFSNGEAGNTLAGTLTFPKSGGPFPAVVLISGSGAQDRDENIFNHKPFKVIADYLSRNGVAVLRYDDRGAGKSSGNFATSTTVDFASDAKAAVAYLHSRKDVDRTKIGLIGHSEGGIIAPMVAAKSKEIAFVILLAGTSITGKDIILLQDSLISLANGVGIDEIRKDLEVGRKMYAIVESEKDTSVLKEKLRAFLKAAAEQKDTTTNKERQEAGIRWTVERIASPWFRYFLFYDPMPTLREVRCPVLALNGEKDLQVPARVNLEGIKQALTQGGNSRAVTIMLPGLNHLFQHATTGSPTEYAKIEETFAPEALSTIANWIHSTLGLKREVR